MKNLLRPYLKNSLRPLIRAYLVSNTGNLEKGLNRRGTRDLNDNDATATRRRLDSDYKVETQAKL